MAIDRNDDGERAARVEALIQQARALKMRGAAAKRRAHDLIARSTQILKDTERRRQRDVLLRRANEALKIAKTSAPTVLRFPRKPRKKSA
jgi:hypothetical protein